MIIYIILYIEPELDRALTKVRHSTRNCNYTKILVVTIVRVMQELQSGQSTRPLMPPPQWLAVVLIGWRC